MGDYSEDSTATGISVATISGLSGLSEIRVGLLGGSGKKSFLQRVSGFDFGGATESRGVVEWDTSKGPVRFHITVYPPYTITGTFLQEDGVVLFYDEKLHAPLRLQSENISVQVNVWSKCDLATQGSNFCPSRKTIDAFANREPFYQISSKTGYNLEKPLLTVARALLGSDLALL